MELSDKSTVNIDLELSFGVCLRTQRLVGAASLHNDRITLWAFLKAFSLVVSPILIVFFWKCAWCTSRNEPGRTVCVPVFWNRVSKSSRELACYFRAFAHHVACCDQRFVCLFLLEFFCFMFLPIALPLVQLGSDMDIIEFLDPGSCCFYLSDSSDGGNGISSAIFDSFERCLEIGQQLCKDCSKCSLNCPNCIALKHCRAGSISRHSLAKLSFPANQWTNFLNIFLFFFIAS